MHTPVAGTPGKTLGSPCVIGEGSALIDDHPFSIGAAGMGASNVSAVAAGPFFLYDIVEAGKWNARRATTPLSRAVYKA